MSLGFACFQRFTHIPLHNAHMLLATNSSNLLFCIDIHTLWWYVSTWRPQADSIFYYLGCSTVLDKIDHSLHAVILRGLTSPWCTLPFSWCMCLRQEIILFVTFWVHLFDTPWPNALLEELEPLLAPGSARSNFFPRAFLAFPRWSMNEFLASQSKTYPCVILLNSYI